MWSYSWLRSFFAIAFVISLNHAVISTSACCSLGSIPRYNITDRRAPLPPSTSSASTNDSSEPILGWLLIKFFGGAAAITAEGAYDPDTGQLCVAGCKKLPVSSFDDCEIAVELEMPPWDGMLSLRRSDRYTSD